MLQEDCQFGRMQHPQAGMSPNVLSHRRRDRLWSKLCSTVQVALVGTLLIFPGAATAQETWQNPPEPIASMLDAPGIPATLISPDNQWMVELQRPDFPTIAELAEPQVRVAGLVLNPRTRGPVGEYAYYSMAVKPLGTGTPEPVALPAGARIRNFAWSPDSQHLAFTLTQADGLELWVLNLRDRRAQRLTDGILNNTYGSPCSWIPRQEALLCKTVPEMGPPPEEPTVPQGPQISENLGRVAPARTYTNLLQTPHDEALFEYYLTSQLERIDLKGSRTRLTPPGLIAQGIPSPDGNWVLLETIHRPFSYQVPIGRFPRRLEILDATGRSVRVMAELPLADDIPVAFGSTRQGRRQMSWRSDRPASLFWVEALDQGDARQQVPLRDAVYQLEAPFADEPTLLWQSELRYGGIVWGREDTAIAYESWYNTRQQRMWRIDPSNPAVEPVLLNERNFQDAYSDPGSPVTDLGPEGRQVLLFNPEGTHIYLNGAGTSPEGVYPFLDQMDLASGETTRLWQAQDPYYERVERLLDPSAQQLITRRQSQTEPPNYFWHSGTGQPQALTQYGDPMPWFQGATAEVVQYQRQDGLTLSATLYLPPNYQPERDGPLPTLLWVYPEEHRSRETASQVTTAENTFRRPYGASVLFLLTQGYAVLAGPTLPIIGEGEEEPNDTYVEQLLASAQAAVDYLVDRGIADRDRLAVGGHSYGAFTSVNLLAHSDLFRTGIAQSGAYNRTLTPFGFQGEQRTFWEAPDTYMGMSPFTYADRIQEPLLLIHGAEDENIGTYPMQSERLYGALQGLGGTVRFVSLPLEGHSYRSREAIGHVLWELSRWLDTYLANPSEPQALQE